MADAIAGYEAAVAAAEEAGQATVLSEALRRLAVARHHTGDSKRARALVHRSLAVARKAGERLLAAEALNTLGGLDLATGSPDEARATFLRALETGGSHRGVRARVEQNLGILANIQGDLAEALARYQRSLDAYRAARDPAGCSIAYNNLGVVSAHQHDYGRAERYFEQSRSIAERCGDLHLQALSLVNLADVDVARQRYENARQNAEAALALFDRVGVRGGKADAYRVIGVAFREAGRPTVAEARLTTAIELSAEAGSVLSEAEASRELAVLYQSMGRNQEALRLLHRAYQLFRRLDARVDLVNVGGKMAELESTYFAVVRAWGESIESTDPYTFGHCERVARFAVVVARLLGLSEHEETTVLLGAYLHDVGKLRIPHEILTKPTRLTPQEREVVRQHPLLGLELLANIEFPWDITPIIRWHHERYDGSGYPDGLRGEAIPVGAQIVAILDVYDSLVTDRPYQPALTPSEAIDAMAAARQLWADRVFDAFVRAVTGPASDSAPRGLRGPAPGRP
ncbi:MAG TPA: tetratricopeptide repeat protein [Gemmatimonadales bacterium]|nr:tetratricopeptide repeat protein [Gemmatimonadales bacterium]